MEPISAVGLVALSYTVSVLGWRRARVLHGRRHGIERAIFAAYDHRALARERATEVAAPQLGAVGPPLPAPASARATLPLGELPGPWRDAPWGRARPADLAEARDLLVAGREAEAVERATGNPAAPSLFVWASLWRLYAGDLDAALDAARALPAAAPEAGPVAARLEAQVLARAVEVTPPGPDRDAALRAALDAARAAGGERPDAPPAVAGLYAHLRVRAIGLLTLETTELAVRRILERAQERRPDAPYLHLVRAHLAAALGEGEASADHLARALYYAHGEPFYARAVLGSGWLARHRPALFAGAAAREREAAGPLPAGGAGDGPGLD